MEKGKHAVDEQKALRELKRKNEKALIWFIDRYSAYVNTIIYNIIDASISGTVIEEIFIRYYYYYQPVSLIAEEMGINISTV